MSNYLNDASREGPGGFWYLEGVEGSEDWKSSLQAIKKDNLFARPLRNDELLGQFDINIFEVLAVATGIERWKHEWRGKKVIIHTDSKTCFSGH